MSKWDDYKKDYGKVQWTWGHTVFSTLPLYYKQINLSIQRKMETNIKQNMKKTKELLQTTDVFYTSST